MSCLGWLEPITGSQERCHGGQPGAASPQGGSEPMLTNAATCTKGSAAQSSGHDQNPAKPLSLRASVTIRTLINSISSVFTENVFSGLAP